MNNRKRRVDKLSKDYEVDCPCCDGRGESMDVRMTPNGHSEFMRKCELCDTSGFVKFKSLYKELELDLETNSKNSMYKEVKQAIYDGYFELMYLEDVYYG